VRYITDDGFLLLDPGQGLRRSSPERRYMIGQVAQVVGRHGVVAEGVFAVASGHTLTQAQMDKPHDYVVYVFWPMAKEAPGRPPQKDKVDMHGGESETSRTMISRPDLVHMDRVQQESGKDLARQKLPPDVYTGIWWYARFPNHYSGDASTASKELGEFDVKTMTNQIVEALKAIKADQVSLQLQNQFYEESKHPLQTKPQ